VGIGNQSVLGKDKVDKYKNAPANIVRLGKIAMSKRWSRVRVKGDLEILK